MTRTQNIRITLLAVLGLVLGIVSIPVDGLPGAALGIAAIALGAFTFRALTGKRAL